MITKSQESIIEDITRRLREELRDVDLKLITIKVDNLEAEEKQTTDKVKIFMETNTEETEKETDILGTTELWTKYEEWNRKTNKEEGFKGSDIGAVNVVLSTNVMGHILTELNYKAKIGKYEGKAMRGYSNLKYRGEADESISVLKFMEKYTEKTNSTLDRVSISKLLPKFYTDNRERYGIETFRKKLNRFGYTTKGARETQRVEGRYGKEKVIKVGEAVLCILRVRLKNEFYREEWTK
jgi:hypothetical protein